MTLYGVDITDFVPSLGTVVTFVAAFFTLWAVDFVMKFAQRRLFMATHGYDPQGPDPRDDDAFDYRRYRPGRRAQLTAHFRTTIPRNRRRRRRY